MEADGDRDYLTFLSHLRACEDSVMLEIKPDGASSPIRVKYEVLNPTSEMKPDRKRLRRDTSPIKAGIEENGGTTPRFEPDAVRSNEKRRKEKKERGNEGIVLETENASFSSNKERENQVTKDGSVDEGVVKQSHEASSLPEPVPAHLQVLALLMKALCPVEKTIYPGWSDGSEVLIRPMAEPSKRKGVGFDSIEQKAEEVKSRHEGNNRCNVKITELSEPEEEPIMKIPGNILSRPPSDYRDRLIRELKRPFDKYEYRELMDKAAHRTKKIHYKELRSMENTIETEAGPRVRERAIETEENSNSYFDWYPEVERKVKRARHGRRLILLRGFFFWLQNCSWEESFIPWEKRNKKSKRPS